jgi:hypothetical protein
MQTVTWSSRCAGFIIFFGQKFDGMEHMYGHRFVLCTMSIDRKCDDVLLAKS